MQCRQKCEPSVSSSLPYDHSVILDNGRYAPGKQGFTKLRVVKTDELLDRNPELQRKFLEDTASWRFSKRQMLRFKDRLTDGFRARYSRELLLFDASVDGTLRCFLQRLRSGLPPASEPQKERVRSLAMAVVDAFGGSLVDSALADRWDKRLRELRLDPPADLPIGKLMGGPSAGRRRVGAGVCRHRAILLKYCCDVLGIAECALVTGVVMPAGARDLRETRHECQVDHMWNVVRIEGQLFLMDCMFFPGDLCDADDLSTFLGIFRLEYHRIDGQAGLSLNSEASRSWGQRASLCARANSSFLLPSQEHELEEWDEADLAADVGCGDVEEELLNALVKANLEQLGSVEVQDHGPLLPCAACGKELDCQRVYPRGCRHAFHVECLRLSWDHGHCPVCHSSFVREQHQGGPMASLPLAKSTLDRAFTI